MQGREGISRALKVLSYGFSYLLLTTALGGWQGQKPAEHSPVQRCTSLAKVTQGGQMRTQGSCLPVRSLSKAM